MFKYTREFKCSVAKECLNGVSSRSLARQYSISSSQISYWAQVFAIHAERSFSPTAIENTALIKLEALNLMWTNNWSINHTSAILNLSSPGTLYAWLKRYEEQGIQGLETHSIGKTPMKQKPLHPTKTGDEMTLEELREELAYLRAENAVLKKLEELEQEKRRRIKKKR